MKRDLWPKLVRDLRRERNLSVRRLADLANINRSTLTRFEAGGGNIRVDYLEAIFAVFGYELDAVLATPSRKRAA